LYRHWYNETKGITDSKKELLIFSIFREPISRVWSEYRHCSNKPKIHCWGSFSKINTTEYNIVKRMPHKFLTHWNYGGHNRQAKYLLGDDWSDELEKTAEGRAKLTDIAIKRLHTLVYIGIHENMFESMRLFCRTFYLTCDSGTFLKEVLNTYFNPQRKLLLPDDLRTTIQESNTIDIAIYDAAKKYLMLALLHYHTLATFIMQPLCMQILWKLDHSNLKKHYPQLQQYTTQRRF